MKQKEGALKQAGRARDPASSLAHRDRTVPSGAAWGGAWGGGSLAPGLTHFRRLNNYSHSRVSKHG